MNWEEIAREIFIITRQQLDLESGHIILYENMDVPLSRMAMVRILNGQGIRCADKLNFGHSLLIGSTEPGSSLMQYGKPNN